jgi:hypothetical protein
MARDVSGLLLWRFRTMQRRGSATIDKNAKASEIQHSGAPREQDHDNCRYNRRYFDDTLQHAHSDAPRSRSRSVRLTCRLADEPPDTRMASHQLLRS